jgi:hypothetical protein
MAVHFPARMRGEPSLGDTPARVSQKDFTGEICLRLARAHGLASRRVIVGFKAAGVYN